MISNSNNNKRDAYGLRIALENFLSENQSLNPTQDMFAIILLDHPSHYEAAKSVLSQYGILSQMILKNTARKGQLSSFSNILK